MSKTDNMAKLPGLHLRGGVYQLRVVVPLDLRPAHGGRTKISESLATADYHEAARLGVNRRAHWFNVFDDTRRALNPRPVAVVGPELGQALAERIRARLLDWDESLRANGRGLGLLVNAVSVVQRVGLRPLMIDKRSPLAEAPQGLPPLPPEWTPLDGLPAQHLQALAALNADMGALAGSQLAARQLSAVQPMADAEARKLGLLIDWRTREAIALLPTCLDAYRTAWADIKLRDAGRVVVTPKATEVAPVVLPTTMRDVFDRWKVSGNRRAASTRAVELALNLFVGEYGNLPVQQVTRDMGDRFRAYLLGMGDASKTSSGRFDAVKYLLLYAAREVELIPKNPWDRLAIKSRKEAPRRVWTRPELIALFGLPIFTRYEVPMLTNAGADAAYWIPLLALFTGATVSELAQMRASDVVVDGESSFLRITVEGEGQQTKNEHRVREVPIHSELVRLGFLDHARALQSHGCASLWPALRLRKLKAGGHFSEWFGVMRKKPPLNFGQYPDLHCFRHSVRSLLAQADTSQIVMDYITGHARVGNAGQRDYTEVPPFPQLRRGVESIQYPGLDLPRVYTQPAALKSLSKRKPRA